MKSALLILSFCLASCAGYHVLKKENPFAGYGVKSVSVPMFVNRTIIPNISAYMSNDIINLLREYSELNVYSGMNENSDAVLLGIVESVDKWDQLIQTTSNQFTDQEFQNSIGRRKPFNLPASSSMSVTLRLVLIRNPRRADLDLLSSPLAKHITKSDRIIFNESISVTADFKRIIKESTSPMNSGTSSDSPGKVNYTKNSYIFKDAAKALSKMGTQKVKEEVLSAF